MKIFLFTIVAFLASANANDVDGHCYQATHEACSSVATLDQGPCNATYGGIEQVQLELQKLVNKHISHSFDYLLLSTHFANYKANRPGFEKVFRELSDSTWEKAIDLIKHLTKRGGDMDFTQRSADYAVAHEVDINELQSMAKALDIQKSLALETFKVHKTVSHHEAKHHDPEITDYLEDELMHKQADAIRELSGHTNDLKNLIFNGKPDRSLSLFLFDEYLQKS